jgi:hypothetical protein
VYDFGGGTLDVSILYVAKESVQGEALLSFHRDNRPKVHPSLRCQFMLLMATTPWEEATLICACMISLRTRFMMPPKGK